MEFLKANQLDIMLFTSGICGALVILTLITKSLSTKRRRIIALLEAASMLLLLSDRAAYIYRGDVSALGYRMVRISNFLVFFLSLYLTHCLTLYLYDLFKHDAKITPPRRLIVCEVLFAAGVVLLIVSQFTGLYYTFDAQNHYQRSRGHLICYFMPIMIMILQLSAILQYRKTLRPLIVYSLLLNTLVPLIASVAQIFAYGLSLTNMTLVGMAILLYIFALSDLNKTVEEAREREISLYREEEKREHEMFEQTAEALANSIDAKDEYTHGHSSRVAIYSQQIARLAGKTDEECEMVYFAGLLHDVGKIGVPDQIIRKDGRLTDEEFAEIKLHPVYGNQILSRIQRSPYLSIGAHHHHERYDGRGYPDGLKGEDIPEIARIIGVADAYDAMTSKRSYRDPLAQDQVREEIVKGMGTQFDPEFAKIMLHMIDLDTEYRMQEQTQGPNLSPEVGLHCVNLLDQYTPGCAIIDRVTKIRLYCVPDEDCAESGLPTLILFDSLDGRIQDTYAKKKDLLYVEYGRIRFDGQTECMGARKIETREVPCGSAAQDEAQKEPENAVRYDIEAMRVNDHMMIRITGKGRTLETIAALPDSSRYSYLSVTGEHCTIRNIHIEQEDTPVRPDAIPRIAEEISYIRGCPEGDLPNIQVDRWRSAATKGVLLTDRLTLLFHAQSLPTARLIWHCPFISVYTSKDGRMDGEGFREFALVRLDGENWESDEHVDNNLRIIHSGHFAGWNEWKDRFREGVDCEVSVWREDNRITIFTENLGIAITCVTTIHDETGDVYVALTGDQCAITNIHLENI